MVWLIVFILASIVTMACVRARPVFYLVYTIVMIVISVLLTHYMADEGTTLGIIDYSVIFVFYFILDNILNLVAPFFSVIATLDEVAKEIEKAEG